MASPVSQLMQGSAVISRCVFEGVFRGKMDAVGAPVVKGVVELIVFDSSTGICENSFTRLDRLK